jgi:hypothetical protein
MDIITQRYFAIFNRLANELRRLGIAVESLCLGIQKRIEANHKTADAEAKSDKTPPVVRAILDVPYPIKTKQETSKIERWLKGWKTLVETGTMIAVIAYTVVAARQLRTMNNSYTEIVKQTPKIAEAAGAATQANIDAGNRFRQDQRPYLWAEAHGGYQLPDNTTAIFVPIPGSGDMFMNVSVTIRNSGKSPAVNVAMPPTAYVIGSKIEARKGAKEYSPLYSGGHGTVLVVGDSRVPVSQKVLVKKDVMDKFRDGSWEIYVLGGVGYGDLFAPSIRNYETTYCYRIQRTGLAFFECDFGPSAFGPYLK